GVLARLFGLAQHRLAQRERHEERVFRIAEEADRRAVPGVEDDAVVDRDVLDRLGQVVREARLEADLLGDRLLRIADQVYEHDAADKRSVSRVEHRATWIDGAGAGLAI